MSKRREPKITKKKVIFVKCGLSRHRYNGSRISKGEERLMAQNAKLAKRNGFFSELSKNKVLFIMLVPALLYVAVFCYAPLSGLVVAFKKYNYVDGIFGSPWAGFNNFKFFFISGKAWEVTRNTVVYNIIFIATSILFEVAAAILLSEMSGKLFKKVSQTFMFLPFFISWVIVGSFVYNIFNFEYGLLNTILRSMGSQPIDIYRIPRAWYFLLPLFNIWKGVGYGSIVYLASITAINPEISSAAEIDGANVFQRIRYVTLPHLKPTVIIMTLLALGRILRGNFDMFYQLIGTSANLYAYTDIIDTYVFRSMISGSDYGMVSAAAFFQSVLCFIFIVTINRIVKFFEKDYALF